jgi:hypothetical protein
MVLNKGPFRLHRMPECGSEGGRIPGAYPSPSAAAFCRRRHARRNPSEPSIPKARVRCWSQSTPVGYRNLVGATELWVQRNSGNAAPKKNNNLAVCRAHFNLIWFCLLKQRHTEPSSRYVESRDEISVTSHSVWAQRRRRRPAGPRRMRGSLSEAILALASGRGLVRH